MNRILEEDGVILFYTVEFQLSYIVEVIFFPKVNSPVFIAFSENEIDTLLVSYQIEERECCDDIEKIIKYQYNQVDYNVINSQVTSFIKK